jgi:dTDP-4-dehydrorhamnose reductase
VKLLVLGSEGQLGHDLVRAARRAGIDVAGLPRGDLDLERDDPVRPLSAHRFDVLVNCAAFTRVDDAESDRDRVFAVNGRAVAGLARGCRERGARLVQISTDYVFDGSLRRAYREDDPTGPLNVYGASKLMGEDLARAGHPDGALIVRTASLFGIAGARRAEAGLPGNFVETMIRRGTAGANLRVVRDIVMSPTGTRDVADAILHLLESDAPAGIYHVANAGHASWYEFARSILSATGIDAAIEPVPASAYPMPASRPAWSVLDTCRIQAAGLVLRPWQEALETYLKERAHEVD